MKSSKEGAEKLGRPFNQNSNYANIFKCTGEVVEEGVMPTQAQEHEKVLEHQ